MFETIKKLFNKEKRFLTTANGGIKLSDDVIDLYGWLDIIYDRRTGILYCGTHKPYFIGDLDIKKILFDELFCSKEDPSRSSYAVRFGEDDFLKTSEIFEAMGIKRRE